MFSSLYVRSSVAAAALLCAAQVSAQPAQAPAAPAPATPAPPPAEAEEEFELEVNAQPGAPAAPAAPVAPAEPAALAAPAPPAAPVPDATAQRIAALEQRTAELEAKLAAQEAAAAKAEPEQPAQVPPANAEPAQAEIESDEDGLGLQVSGYIQAQYESSQLSEDQLQQGGVPWNRDRFVLRRARFRIDQLWEYAGLVLEMDANTTRGLSVSPRRAYASVRYPSRTVLEVPYVQLTAGLQDIPFGYEIPFGSERRVFMERSLGSLALFPGDPDLGAALSGGLGPLRYVVAAMNGQPLDERAAFSLTDPNEAKDIIARVGVDTEPAEGFTVAGGVSFLTGEGFHPGNEAVKSDLRWRDDNGDLLVQPTELTTVAASSGGPSENFHRWGVNADLELGLQTGLGQSLLYGEVTLAENLDRGLYIADPVAQGGDIREFAAYIAFLQEITPYGIVGFRFDVYDANSDFTESRRGEIRPESRSVRTYSPLIGLVLPDVGRLVFQYDFIDDSLGRDARGVPADLKNNQWTLRLQVGT